MLDAWMDVEIWWMKKIRYLSVMAAYDALGSSAINRDNLPGAFPKFIDSGTVRFMPCTTRWPTASIDGKLTCSSNH